MIREMQDRITLLGPSDETVDPETLQRSGEPAEIATVSAAVSERSSSPVVRGDSIEFPVRYTFQTHRGPGYENARFIDHAGNRFRVVASPMVSARDHMITFQAVAEAGL